MKRFFGLLLALVFAVSGISVAAAEDCAHENATWVRLNGRGCALYCSDCWQYISEEQPHQYGEDGICTRCHMASKPWRAEELAEPVISVTVDKDSYDLYNQMKVTVTVTNPEEVADWWPKEAWRQPESWLTDGMYADSAFRLYASDGGYQSARFTVEEVTDYSMTLTLDGLFVVTPEDYPEMTGDLLFEVDIVLMNNYDMRLYCPVTVHYTGECVPCEGEHVFGDWMYAGGSYIDEKDAYGHMRICSVCGYRELIKEHCTPSEPKKEDILDKEEHDTACYQEYVCCTVCGYTLEYSEHHTDLHPVDDGYPADCTHWGLEDSYEVCDACGRMVFDNYVYRQLPPLGHDMDNGICTRCHQTFSQLDCIATMTVDKTEVGEGELLVATYTIKDAQNNPLSGVAVTGFCTAYPGYEESAVGKKTTDENGMVRFNVRPYTMFNIYDGTPLGVQYVSATAEGYGDSAATAAFTFTGKGKAKTYTGTLDVDKALIGDYDETEDMITFTMEIKDDGGEPVPAAMVGFAIKDLKGNVVDGPYWWISDGAGVCTLRFLFTREEIPAGTYTVEVTCGGSVLRQNFDFISPSPFLPGDPDGDGKVTSTDARLALQVAVGKIEDDDVTCPEAMDVDGDGKVTSTDARLMLQKAVGKIEAFPA